AAALVLLVVTLPATVAGPAVLPPATYIRFLSGLSIPTLAPGSSELFQFTVTNPLPATMTSVVLSFGVYAFNAYPGNATGPVPAGEAPTFSGTGAPPSPTVSIAIGTLAVGGSYGSPGSVGLAVAAPAGAPQGTYAVRTSLTFSSGGSPYVLESRGYFSAAAWANATSAPNAPSTLNASRLGVSGVIPESAVLVRSNPFPLALGVVLAGALVLAAVGGYWAVRRRPGPRSGASAAPPPSQADTALGNKRTSDGD
ncbi:MAG: hypothetical protein L3J81_06235, partial [Thermoplasmata archaeon]|nr:hypothetical protein [Thermoplasmata archaeon]